MRAQGEKWMSEGHQEGLSRLGPAQGHLTKKGGGGCKGPVFYFTQRHQVGLWGPRRIRVLLEGGMGSPRTFQPAEVPR